MIEKALKYLIGLGAANIREIRLPDGAVQTYSDKPLNRLYEYIPMAERIDMSTLSSLVDYIKSHVDKMADKMIVHVTDPDEVILFSQLDKERNREYLVKVKAQIPSFRYQDFIGHE